MILQRTALLSLPLLCTALAAMAGGPLIQPNDYYDKVGREQVEKDIRTCSKTARALDAPRREDTSVSVGGFSTGGAGDGDDGDPIYQNTVQRCLSNKGYNVVGWR